METLDKLAEAVEVDPKTVERWITKGRVPYRKHRYDVAAFFGVDEAFIWPDALSREQVAAVSESEIVAVYPHRWMVPRDIARMSPNVGPMKASTIGWRPR